MSWECGVEHCFRIVAPAELLHRGVRSSPARLRRSKAALRARTPYKTNSSSGPYEYNHQLFFRALSIQETFLAISLRGRNLGQGSTCCYVLAISNFASRVPP